MINPKLIKKAKMRLLVLLITYLLVILLIVFNIFYIGVTKKHLYSQKNVIDFRLSRESKGEEIFGIRGRILDRNGKEIAKDEIRYDIFATIKPTKYNPDNYVKDIEGSAKQLAPLLNTTPQTLIQYMNSDSIQVEFGTVGRKLSADVKDRIDELKLPGISFTSSLKRVYNYDFFASHLIGFTKFNEETKRIEGISGLEKELNSYLQSENGLVTQKRDRNGVIIPGTQKIVKEAKNGADVYLTIDANLQEILEIQLQKFSQRELNKNHPEFWAVVLDPKTGEILATSSYPSYNLNELVISDYTNRISMYPYEVGSVFKPIVYASAISEGAYSHTATEPANEFHVAMDGKNSFKRANSPSDPGYITTIHNAERKRYGNITYDEGLVRSTNTSVLDLYVKHLGKEKMDSYFDKLGIFQKVDILGIPNISGANRFNNQLDQASTLFGQASSLNSLQLVQAYTAIVNDGILSKPYVVSKIKKDNDILLETTLSQRRVFNEGVSKEILPIMQRVVEEGTGRRFKVEGLNIAGKTGTAEVFEGSGYSSSKIISSVMLTAPVEEPDLLMYFANKREGYLIESQDIRDAFVQMLATRKNAHANNENKQTYYTQQKMKNLKNHSLEYAKDAIKGFSSNIFIIGSGESVIEQYPKEKELAVNTQPIFLLTSKDKQQIPMINLTGMTRKDVMAFTNLIGIPVEITGMGRVKSQSIAVDEIIGDKLLIVELE